MAGAFTDPESVEGGLLGQTLNQVQGDGFHFRVTVQSSGIAGSPTIHYIVNVDILRVSKII